LLPGEIRDAAIFFDLANVGSVSAILTEDFGIVNPTRPIRVRVMGRAGVAEPRGIARLAIEEFEADENQRLQWSEASDIDLRTLPNTMRARMPCAKQSRGLGNAFESIFPERRLAADQPSHRHLSDGAKSQLPRARRAAISVRIATALQWSTQLLDESIDALLLGAGSRAMRSLPSASNRDAPAPIGRIHHAS